MELLPTLDAQTVEPESDTPTSRSEPDGASESGGIYREIAQAHQEVYALYELSSSLGRSLGVSESMSLIAGPTAAAGTILMLCVVLAGPRR